MNYEEELKEIFNKVGCDYEYLLKHPEENLLGRNIGLSARDLLVIYVEIVNRFKIHIPRELVIKGEFNTYASISEIVLF